MASKTMGAVRFPGYPLLVVEGLGSACVQRLVSGQRSCCSVDATLKRTEQTCRALRIQPSVRTSLRGTYRPVTCASFVMVKCHASSVEQGKRFEIETWLDRNKRGSPTSRIAALCHLFMTANDCHVHCDAAMLVFGYSHTSM